MSEQGSNRAAHATTPVQSPRDPLRVTEAGSGRAEVMPA